MTPRNTGLVLTAYSLLAIGQRLLSLHVPVLKLPFLGGNALFYFLASFWFSVGLHPLGARWIQEHYAAWPGQGTFDYYGPLNFFALNIGYHNEHHDFQEIPWTLLPKLKAMAPEFYDDLHAHKSWVKLFLDFIFNPRYSLMSRTENLAATPPMAPAE